MSTKGPGINIVIDTASETNNLVLIVDDDPAVRLMMSSVLEALGIRVEEAEDGEQALLFLETITPDLVLLDVTMPGMDGFALCERMKEAPGISEIPIVMVTGSDDTCSIQRAYDLGVTDFITKPISWPLIGYRISFLIRGTMAISSLKKNEQRLSRAQRLACMGTWGWELASDKMWFSDEVKQIFRLDPLGFDASFQTFMSLVHPVDCERVLTTTATAIESASSYSIDHQLLLCDGTTCFVHTEASVITDRNGRPIRLEGAIQDITERKAAEEQIRHLAFFDMLTGLPNRSLFMDYLKRLHYKAQADKNKFAILFIDIDGFKSINDTLGHVSGDQLLQQLALRLKESVRSDDFVTAGMVARLGGDEFVVIIDNFKNSEDIAIIAQRILCNIRVPLQLEGTLVMVTASIGISIFPDDCTDTDSLIKHADIAMYAAKDNGKNSFQYFSQSMHDAATSRLELEKELRMAIENEEFTVHYQPQMELITRQIVRLEALIRWSNPKLGQVSPAAFIPIAENSNLIWDIDRWVINEVCRQIRRWQNDGVTGVQIAINLSARSITHKDLVPFLRQEIERHSVAPQLLQIEITEGVFMVDAGVAKENLEQLRDMGISVAIDDFGTGYSSLQYLQSLPVDTIKIDLSFVSQILNINERAPVISAIIALSQSLELSVVAEGIEHEVQLDFLRNLRCSIGQGYLFSHPLPAEQVLTLLACLNRRSSD